MPKSEPSVLNGWQDAWTEALALWSRYTKLRYPTFCETHVQASKQGLTDSFAMIRLLDQSVVIDLEAIAKYDLQDYAVEILAHEIGHHILSPSTLTDHARMITRMRNNLPTIEHNAAMVANLYSDLLINNHLKRQFELKIDDVYRRINQGSDNSRVWQLYMRICEHLWQLRQGSLGGYSDSDAMEGDAWLGARIIRVYATDWLKGASRFATLLLPYLVEEQKISDQISKLMDTRDAGDGQFPPGLISKEAGEDDSLHPSEDPALTGVDASGQAPGSDNQRIPVAADKPIGAAGQYREPFEYGEILRSVGISLPDHEIAIRYYRERAIPLLISFPSRRQPVRADLIPEGTAPWEPGEPLEDVDWFSTLATSPVVIPGVTTVQRVWSASVDLETEATPCDLDLYVDCSGSMPDPQQVISYTALAGTILCLSALRAGSFVQVTLWSGAQQFRTTDGFVRNEHQALEVLTDYIGGGTAFPIHVLRKTHLEQRRERDTHVVILSDDGVTTLFDQDEKGNSGWDIAGRALVSAGGGGIMVLNLPWQYPAQSLPEYVAKHDAMLQQAQQEQGWDIYPVTSWESMVEFAQTFSREHYESNGE